MPELPEVETVARTLTPLVQGRRITGVTVLRPSALETGSLPLASLTGRRIAHAGRRGKLVLLYLEASARSDPHTPFAVAVHLKMTGRLFVYPGGTAPGRHTRIIVHMDGPAGREELFFDDIRAFGYLRVLSPASLAAWPFWQQLGPEPLELTAAAFRYALSGRRGAVKAVLLDQRVVAGIGNIYADESLFRAGIDPRTSVEALSPERLALLLRQLKAVLRESIRHCGSSIRDYRTARGDAGAFQNRFRVYGRAGQACVRCGHTLSSAKVAGRTSVFCPHCQH